MTQKQCLGQIRKLMGTWQKGGLHVLMDECEHLAESGGIDISDDKPDSFYSAKIILHVALLELAEQLRPISQTGNELAENLKNF